MDVPLDGSFVSLGCIDGRRSCWVPTLGGWVGIPYSLVWRWVFLWYGLLSLSPQVLLASFRLLLPLRCGCGLACVGRILDSIGMALMLYR